MSPYSGTLNRQGLPPGIEKDETIPHSYCPFEDKRDEEKAALKGMLPVIWLIAHRYHFVARRTGLQGSTARDASRNNISQED